MPDDTPSHPEPRPDGTPVNPFWKAVIVTGFLFFGTALASVMTQFGDQASPANRFLRKHGSLLAAVEVGAVLISGVLAMAIDQRHSRVAPPTPSSANESARPATGESSDVG